MQPERRQKHHTCSLTNALNGASISSIFGSAIVSRVTCRLTFLCFFLLPHALLKSTDVRCSFRLGMKIACMLWVIFIPEQNTNEINFICQNTFHVRTTWNNHISQNTITVIPHIREYNTIFIIPHLMPSILIDHIFFLTHSSTCGIGMDTEDDLWAQRTTTLRFVPHFMLIVTEESR